jgi:glucose-1-phosphate thymidylyltransferase
VTLVETVHHALIEKPSEPISNQATVGIYYFREIEALYAAIDEQMRLGIKTKNEYFIADAIQIMIDGGARFETSNIDIWEDCGNADALLQTNRYLLKSSPPSPAQRPGSVIIPPSFVDSSAEVETPSSGQTPALARTPSSGMRWFVTP